MEAQSKNGCNGITLPLIPGVSGQGKRKPSWCSDCHFAAAISEVLGDALVPNMTDGKWKVF